MLLSATTLAQVSNSWKASLKNLVMLCKFFIHHYFGKLIVLLSLNMEILAWLDEIVMLASPQPFIPANLSRSCLPACMRQFSLCPLKPDNFTMPGKFLAGDGDQEVGGTGENVGAGGNADTTKGDEEGEDYEGEEDGWDSDEFDESENDSDEPEESLPSKRQSRIIFDNLHDIPDLVGIRRSHDILYSRILSLHTSTTKFYSPAKRHNTI